MADTEGNTIEEKFFGRSHKITITWLRLLLLVIVSTAVTATAVTAVIDSKLEDKLVEESRVFEESLNGLLAESCANTGNIDSAYRILISDYIKIEDPKAPNFNYISDQIYRIVDCEASLETGAQKIVYLSEHQEDKFLKIVADGQKPLVSEGKVVGQEEFPAERP